MEALSGTGLTRYQTSLRLDRFRILGIDRQRGVQGFLRVACLTQRQRQFGVGPLVRRFLRSLRCGRAKCLKSALRSPEAHVDEAKLMVSRRVCSLCLHHRLKLAIRFGVAAHPQKCSAEFTSVLQGLLTDSRALLLCVQQLLVIVHRLLVSRALEGRASLLADQVLVIERQGRETPKKRQSAVRGLCDGHELMRRQ